MIVVRRGGSNKAKRRLNLTCRFLRESAVDDDRYYFAFRRHRVTAHRAQHVSMGLYSYDDSNAGLLSGSN